VRMHGVRWQVAGRAGQGGGCERVPAGASMLARSAKVAAQPRHVGVVRIPSNPSSVYPFPQQHVQTHYPCPPRPPLPEQDMHQPSVAQLTYSEHNPPPPLASRPRFLRLTAAWRGCKRRMLARPRAPVSAQGRRLPRTPAMRTQETLGQRGGRPSNRQGAGQGSPHC
jgi:hypothetical protein